MILTLRASGSPGGLLKHRLLGPPPRVSGSESLGWDARTGISNRSPGDADAAGLGTRLLVYRNDNRSRRSRLKVGEANFLSVKTSVSPTTNDTPSPTLPGCHTAWKSPSEMDSLALGLLERKEQEAVGWEQQGLGPGGT